LEGRARGVRPPRIFKAFSAGRAAAEALLGFRGGNNPGVSCKSLSPWAPHPLTLTTPQSIFTFASRITLPHIARSALMNAVNSAGVLQRSSPP
jgi:hypothetical protein